MATSSYRLESGMQLLSRLIKKPPIKNFYPQLFQSVPKPGEVIELLSSMDTPECLLLIDLISTALLPTDFGGTDMGILVFNCSGNLNYDTLVKNMGTKIMSYAETLSKKEVDVLIEKQWTNLHVVEIHDATQYFTTIYNLENVLLEHPNITIVIFDTITAFYWSEQYFKIMKMDTYLKKLLSKIQLVTKEHNVVVLYSKPDYFISSKDGKDNLESCSEFLEGINYKISVSYDRDSSCYLASVKSHNMQLEKRFSISPNDQITWV